MLNSWPMLLVYGIIAAVAVVSVALSFRAGQHVAHNARPTPPPAPQGAGGNNQTPSKWYLRWYSILGAFVLMTLGIIVGFLMGLSAGEVAATVACVGAVVIAFLYGGKAAMKDGAVYTKTLFYIVFGSAMVIGFAIFALGPELTFAVLGDGVEKLQTETATIRGNGYKLDFLDVKTTLPILAILVGVVLLLLPEGKGGKK